PLEDFVLPVLLFHVVDEDGEQAGHGNLRARAGAGYSLILACRWEAQQELGEDCAHRRRKAHLNFGANLARQPAPGGIRTCAMRKIATMMNSATSRYTPPAIVRPSALVRRMVSSR